MKLVFSVRIGILDFDQPQSIIFIRDRNIKGQEISGYIDYAHRLKIEDCNPYFEGKKKFLPKNTDLSFYNWDTASTMSTSTPNFQVTVLVVFCYPGSVFSHSDSIACFVLIQPCAALIFDYKCGSDGFWVRLLPKAKPACYSKTSVTARPSMLTPRRHVATIRRATRLQTLTICRSSFTTISLVARRNESSNSRAGSRLQLSVFECT